MKIKFSLIFGLGYYNDGAINIILPFVKLVFGNPFNAYKERTMKEIDAILDMIANEKDELFQSGQIRPL